MNAISAPFYLTFVGQIIYYLVIVYYIALILAVTVGLTFLIISVVSTDKSVKKLQEISRYSCSIYIYRQTENENDPNHSKLTKINTQSTELLLGDLKFQKMVFLFLVI